MSELFSREKKQHLLNDIAKVANRAGGAILEVYAGKFEVETKDDDSPLTIADKRAHEVIVEGLMQICPDIPILSEEGIQLPFEVRENWRAYWLIDPLDGTKEFINRNGEFTVNIALIENGYPVIGVVGYPVAGKIFVAATEVGAFEIDLHNDSRQPLSVKTLNNPETIRVVASKSHMDERLQAALDSRKEVETVAVGSSLKFCLLAQGKADFYPRFGPTSEWDIAAAQCVLEVAGGKVITLDGERMRFNQKESLINPDFVAVADPEYDWEWVKG